MPHATDRKPCRFRCYNAFIMMIALALSLAASSVVSADSNARQADTFHAGPASGSAVNSIAAIEINKQTDPSAIAGQVPNGAGAKSNRSTYIVVLKDEPLALYMGGVAGYEATSIQAGNTKSGKNKAANSRGIGRQKLNARSPQSVRYLSYLADQRSLAIDSAGSAIGRGLDVRYEYGATIVGFAADMTAEEAKRVAAMDKVAFVELEKISYPHTDAGPAWSGASEVWGGGLSALSYTSTLSGSEQAPPVSSAATGAAEFSYDFHSNELSFSIVVDNPDAASFTAMHIHQAGEGSNGPVVHDFNLAPTSSGFTEAGSLTLSDAGEAALVNGELYVNVHSNAYPAGEIRGQLGLVGSLGEGVVVGVIDTGIDPWNPSFLQTGGDGYVHANPRGAGDYVGVCDPAASDYDPGFPCNEKLIGAWGYPGVGQTARDTDGHGSHTASTAAGNIVFDAVVEAPTGTFTADISGVAPHANIIAYSACCAGAALTAARDQALLDGVDVINYSIGSSSPTGNLWEDSESIQWLALRDAGVFVATSNGNSGNGDATTGSPADLPWLTSVGASSHDRAFLVTLIATDTADTSITVSGQAITSGYGPAEIVFSSDVSDTESARLCAPGAFPPGTFNGEIVICERGTYGRVDKGQSVLNGGAGGFVLAQPDEETGGAGSVAADTHALPAVHIDYNEYQLLRQFLLTDAVGTVTGVLSGASLDLDDGHGDIMASFSSRGPNRSDADLIVPHVTAPGRAILAAYDQGAGGDGDYTFNVIQGTSMSSPHVAGAGALLTALHPDWTPAEMQSALMMTARNTVLDDDGVTVASPFAQGSGHIDIALAAASPLIMDATKTQYEAANPGLENDFGLRDLNIASLGEDQCVGSCLWTRRVENASGETLSWSASFNGPASVNATVSPSAFTLAPGVSQLIEVELDVNSAPIAGEWVFAAIDFNETSGNYPDGHWPVAVVPYSSNLASTLLIEARDTSGFVEIDDVVSRDISDFYTEVTGLITADRHEFTLLEDNDTSADFPDIFFDDPSTTHFVAITVPAGSFSVIAEIVSTTSPDLDMLLFLDADGNGPDLDDVGDPEENPDACQSAMGGSAESCEILSPTAGTYYVAVINFSQVTEGGDPVDLATVVVPEGGADEGNMTVTGPAMVSNNTPYTLTVSYDEPGMVAIDKLYGYFTIGSDPGKAANVATVRVALDYLGVPDIAVNPTALNGSVAADARLSQTLVLSTTGGVLDWDILDSPDVVEAVQDGSFEEGYAANPYWRAGASVASTILPICSAATCGPDFASRGEWYLWMGGTANLTSYAEQDITIASDSSATLGFKMLMGAAEPLVATASLTISIDGATVAVYTEADLADFASYTIVNLDVSAYADGASHLLRFDFENPSPANLNMIIDEVSLLSGPAEVQCKGINGISWLSIVPFIGSLYPGEIDLSVTYYSTGLTPGIYTERLCINSNDPDEPVLIVPVTMTVEADRTLDITLAGDGSGTVSSSPAGIDCGADCSGQFDYLSEVTLNANADPGSLFTGWSGDQDCADGIVSMATDVTCTATFILLIPPVFSVAFDPSTIYSNETAMLTFTIDNSASAHAASD